MLENGNASLDEYGEIIHREDGRVTLRVPKAETSRVAARLLNDHDVLDLTIEEVEQIKRSAQTPVSLEKPVGDEEESEFGHFLTDESEPLPDEAAEVAMRREALRAILGALSPRERQVLELRYGLDGRRMATLQEHTIVMHPGPMIRGMEITADVADSQRSVIVEQVTNGVAVRMAVLYLLLGGAEPAIGGDA